MSEQSILATIFNNEEIQVLENDYDRYDQMNFIRLVIYLEVDFKS